MGVFFCGLGLVFALKELIESHSRDSTISHLKFHFQVMLNSEDENWAQTPLNAGRIYSMIFFTIYAYPYTPLGV